VLRLRAGCLCAARVKVLIAPAAWATACSRLTRRGTARMCAFRRGGAAADPTCRCAKKKSETKKSENGEQELDIAGAVPRATSFS
jgi:hypothetical protein